MTSERQVTVQIFSQIYHISSDEHGPDFMRRAAAYLDGKMRTAALSAGNRSALDVAILAALEIADEVVEQRRRKESMLNEVDQRISGFTRRLENQHRPSSDACASDSSAPPA